MKRGFSLIEILLAFALLSVTLVFLGDILFSTNQFNQTSQSQIEVENESRFATDKIMKLIQRASGVDVPQPDKLNLNINGTSYTITKNQSAIALTNQLSGEVNNLTGNLVNVQSLSFEKITQGTLKPTIQIKLSLESQISPPGRPKITSQIQTTASLR